jgi:SP family arabinose:H+ symporter-like MFS transporter
LQFWLVGQFFSLAVGKSRTGIYILWRFAVFSSINLIFSLTILKETKGKTLEEMDTAFVAPALKHQ